MRRSRPNVKLSKCANRTERQRKKLRQQKTNKVQNLWVSINWIEFIWFKRKSCLSLCFFSLYASSVNCKCLSDRTIEINMENEKFCSESYWSLGQKASLLAFGSTKIQNRDWRRSENNYATMERRFFSDSKCPLSLFIQLRDSLHFPSICIRLLESVDFNADHELPRSEKRNISDKFAAST